MDSVLQETVKKDPIFSLFTAIRNTHVLYMAHEVKLFSILNKKAFSLQEIAPLLQMHERAALALLSMCTSLELLTIKNAKYELTPLAKHYLVPDSPYYFGDFIDMALSNPDVLSYEKFKKGIFSNISQVYNEEELFDKNEIEREKAQTFTKAMHGKSMTAAWFWPQVINLSPYDTFLDIAGGSGAHSMGVVSRWPHLKAMIYDRPFVCEVASQYIEQAKLSQSIEPTPGNMWTDDYPLADIHFYSDVLHDWPLEKCQWLLAKSYKHLPQNGRVMIHELLFADDKSGPLSTAVYNLIMLLWTQGRQYTGLELSNLLESIGFKDIQILSTGFGDWKLMTGVKR